MNQVFDFNRWLLLMGKHWSENRKKYLLSLLALVALLVIWYSFILIMEHQYPFPDVVQVSTYYVGMALAGCLFGSLVFAELAGGPKAMHYLSVPASTLEKLLTGLLYSVVLFFICYTAVFYLVDYVMVNLSNSILESYWKERDPQHQVIVQKVANVFYNGGTNPELPDDENFFFYFLLIYFNLQAAFILGSIYFPGYSFIKTCISLLVVFLLFVFLMANVLDGIMPGGHFTGFFAYQVFEEGSTVPRGVKISDGLAGTIRFLFMYGFMPLFWFATYYRLKEKEV